MNNNLLNKEKTVFVLIDLQEKFIPVIHEVKELIKNSNILINASELFEIPLIVTEQYPQGLGNTVSEICVPKNAVKIEKTVFSCFDSNEFVSELNKFNPDSIVLFGVEAHVCVFKTAMNALKKGLNVFVVADAVSSRTFQNKKIALNRLTQANAFIESTEMILFQLLKDSKENEFKELSKLIK